MITVNSINFLNNISFLNAQNKSSIIEIIKNIRPEPEFVNRVSPISKPTIVISIMTLFPFFKVFSKKVIEIMPSPVAEINVINPI